MLFCNKLSWENALYGDSAENVIDPHSRAPKASFMCATGYRVVSERATLFLRKYRKLWTRSRRIFTILRGEFANRKCISRP